MKKLSKEERKEIYLKAAGHISVGYGRVCCYALDAARKNEEYNPSPDVENREIINEFPEFSLFEPYRGCYNWLEKYKPPERDGIRETILCLCTAMCN